MTKQQKNTSLKKGIRPVIELSKPKRFGLDIQTYINAINSAENTINPRRYQLFDLYADILSDAHLYSVIQKRKASVLSVPIKFIDKDGNPIDEVNKHIHSPWFSRFVSQCIDSIFWGFSLFQLDRSEDGWITAELINRKHVSLERREILYRQTDSFGTPFDRFYNLLLIGEENELGLLAKAAPFVIYKRNAMGDWSQYAELFGMPVREYTYDATDEETRQQVLIDAQNQGAASVYVHPNDSTFKLLDTAGKSGSVDVYKSLTERCNNEISKLILGNTLTTEAGETGTQALGTVQAKGEDLITKSDREMILNILNYDLTDIFFNMGIDTSNGSFVFEETENVDIEKQLRIVQGLNQMGLPISDSYLYEKFGVEKPTVKEEKATSKKDNEEEEEEELEEMERDGEAREVNKRKKLFDRLKDFFVKAPKKGAIRHPSDW